MTWHVQRDVDPQIRLTLAQASLVSTKHTAKSDAHRIPLRTPIHPRRQILVGTDINIQAVGLIAPTTFIGRHVRLAVILRIPGRTGVYDFDDDSPIDLVVGRRAV